jgi:hypothetical protein
MQSFRFFMSGERAFPIFSASEVLENNRVKKSFVKLQIFLDKFSKCAMLCLVRKCAPTQSGLLLFRATQSLLPLSGSALTGNH